MRGPDDKVVSGKLSRMFLFSCFLEGLSLSPPLPKSSPPSQANALPSRGGVSAAVARAAESEDASDLHQCGDALVSRSEPLDVVRVHTVQSASVT